MGLCLHWAGCGPAPAPPTDTLQPGATATNASFVYGECAWSWANRPLPELTDQLQAALDAAGIPGATARAYDFGEIGLNFVMRGATRNWLYFYDEQLEEARERGLSGRALSEALGYPP